jgi:Exostosin family
MHLTRHVNRKLHAGEPWCRPNDINYSGGVRQKLMRLHNATKGFVISQPGSTEGDAYLQAMRDAIFCLAPGGHGWGIRLLEVVAQGCIPVIIQARTASYTQCTARPAWQAGVHWHGRQDRQSRAHE